MLDERNAAFQDGAIHPAPKPVSVLPFSLTSAFDQTRPSTNGLGEQTYRDRLYNQGSNGYSDSARDAATARRYSLLNANLFGGLGG